ncbi:kinase-like domain-containing protein, partial [Pavlovales sp. CCMP2436]
LGRGAFSRVRLATSCATGERVAVKTLRKSTLQLEHVQAELKILASLRGRQIVRLLHVVTDPDSIHLVLEYVRGVPLSQLCARPRWVRLSEPIVRKIGAQFVMALQCIHSLGVLHRDIKPENAILVGEYTIKIVDFGLSVIAEAEEPPAASADAGLASAANPPPRGAVHSAVLGLKQLSAGRRVGTPPYMAPEVVTDADYSRASEYWALGCVMYELVTTERLFDGPTVEVVLDLI